MGWQGDQYIYSKRELEAIAINYQEITMSVYFPRQSYEGGVGVSYHPLLDYKVDFDMALNSIGRGHWVGDIEDKEFDEFWLFGKLQRVVIADIYWMGDYELGQKRFYSIPRLRNLAYSFMAKILNGESIGQRGRWGVRAQNT